MNFGPYKIEDYIVIHLSHSKNTKLNQLLRKNIVYCKGLENYVGQELRTVWKNLLSPEQKHHFRGAYWDKMLMNTEWPFCQTPWYDYIFDRNVKFTKGLTKF